MTPSSPTTPGGDGPDDLPDHSVDGVKGERRAPVVITVLIAMALPFGMPAPLTFGPRWIIPALLGVILVVMLVTDPGRIDRRSVAVRTVRLALIVVLAIDAAVATGRLVADIIGGGSGTSSASDLLRGGSITWLHLVIAFGFLYWELDRGGPGERAHRTGRKPDLLFPQDTVPDAAPVGWRPVFVDYLYLGLTDALAFSPTDAMPLTHWAKSAMAIESVASLVVLGLVVARAVNILS